MEAKIASKALMAAVRDARSEARAEAKACNPWIRSRGTYLCTASNGGDQCAPHPEAECPTWSGRVSDVLALVAEVEAKHPHVGKVYISGGFDGADTFADLWEHDNYEPWVSAWDVTLWTREGGLVGWGHRA